jgi:CopG family nickel-responsive transcriptional regulator
MDYSSMSINEEIYAKFDELWRMRGYSKRSEATRDLICHQLAEHNVRQLGWRSPCIANLSYAYSHHERELNERLASIEDAHHHLIVATMHAHFNDFESIKTVIVKGRVGHVQDFADRIVGEPGVRHGQLNLVSVEYGKIYDYGRVNVPVDDDCEIPF